MSISLKNQKVLQPIILALVLIASVGCSLPARSQAIKCDISLVNSKPSLGEPIVLNYKLTNTSTEPVEIDWQHEITSLRNSGPNNLPPWLGITFIQSLGREIPCVPDTRWKMSGVRSEPPPILQPGMSREEQIVLSLWFTPDRTGRYRILFKPHLSYSSAKDSGVLAEEKSLELVINMRNPARLLRVAQGLRDQTEDKTLTYQQRETAVHALFTMPEDVVLPVWRSLLIGHKSFYKVLALGYLRKLDTPNTQALHREVNAADLEAKNALYRIP
jgi:hypothetical protein